MDEVTTAAAEFDNDPGIGAILITGNEKAFAAGADIKEMAELSFADVFAADFFAPWGKFARHAHTRPSRPSPGYALGGGCELAMMCDLLIAADTAKFGQPEIKLGVLPGMGGSQRLTRAIGKAKAMDLILTGRTIDADEADRSRLVSRVVPADTLLDEANAVATTIAGMSLSASRMAKEAVNRAFEIHARRGTALRAQALPLRVRHRGPDRGHERVHREAPAELHAPLKCARDRHRGGDRRSTTARGGAGQAAAVASALHLRRHRRRAGVPVVLDDTVAAAARSAVPGHSSAALPVPSATPSACSRSGWCASCGPRTPARRRRAGRGSALLAVGIIGQIADDHLVPRLAGRRSRPDGCAPAEFWRPPAGAVLAIVVLFVFVEIGQLVGRLVRFLVRQLNRVAPPRVSAVVVVVLLLALSIALLNGVVVRYTMKALNSTFATVNDEMDPDTPAPTTRLRSGGPESRSAGRRWGIRAAFLWIAP